MNYKYLLLGLYLLITVIHLIIDIINYRSRNNPLPNNVSDIYDAETYKKWKQYKSENIICDVTFALIDFAIQFTLIATNAYALLANALTGDIYFKSLIILFIFIVVDTFISVIHKYVSDFKIEAKYDFNTTSVQTFITDQIKSFIIEAGLVIGLTMLFAVIHINLGDWILLLFFGVLIVIVIFLVFFLPQLSKLYNKFTPLEDGSLKTKILNLLTKHGYKVKSINVMDASKRTTKSNAYFAGYGKNKTIVLYDTLIKNMTEDEIVAIFAHEMGHGLHKDTLKNMLRSFLNIGLIVVIMWLLVRYPYLYNDFGFDSMNYGFALVLLMGIVMPLYLFIYQFIVNAFSRKAEFKADEQAVEEGYGKELISALKKLAKENFADLSPNKFIVIMSYSHPPISQRIEAIEKKLTK